MYPIPRTIGLLAAAGIAWVHAADADTYVTEVSGGGEQFDVGDVLEVDRTDLSATYYFEAIDSAQRPLAVAPFLSRSSRVTASLHRDDEVQTLTDISGNVLATTTEETRGVVVSGRHVWRDRGWYLGAAAGNADRDAPQSTVYSIDIDLKSYTLAIGKYVLPSTAVGLNLAQSSTVQDIEPLPACATLPFCPAAVGFEIRTDAAALSVFHVGEVRALTYSLSGGLQTSHIEVLARPAAPSPAPAPSGPAVPFNVGLVAAYSAVVTPNATSLGRVREYSAAGELFPTERLGIRLGYRRWDGDDVRDEAYELAATWFFKERIAAQVSTVRADRDAPDPLSRSDSASFSLLGRF